MINKYSSGGGQNTTNPINKKRKILYLVALSMFSIGIITLSTYALYNNELITGINKIETGQVKMSYTEINELTLNNALPMKDEEGKKLNNYFDFTVSSWIKTKADDNAEQKLNYNIILEPTYSSILGQSASLQEISASEMEEYYHIINSVYHLKTYLTKIDDNGTETEVAKPINVEDLNGVITQQEETFKNAKEPVTTKYRLRIWIDYEVDANSIVWKKLEQLGGTTIKFRVNVNTNKIEQTTTIPILNLPVGTSQIKKVTHGISNTLQVDNRFATEYRYQGTNPNNYIKFNNELWRIIGVIPTDDGTGKVENRLKIIRNESIGEMPWNACEYSNIGSDSNPVYTCNDTGKFLNDWTGSTLNTYLNTTYYNSLTKEARDMIGTTKYYLGSSGDEFNDYIWEAERSNESENYYSYNGVTNPLSETNKISLVYPSDIYYGYNYEIPILLYQADLLSVFEYYKILKLNWSKTDYVKTSVDSSHTINFNDDTHVDIFDNMATSDWYPVLSLSSNVKISGGTGTSTDPYTLSLQ